MLEDVPGSFCGTSSSSSESMGLCFFAFGKSLGFFTLAVVFFPLCLCGLSFLSGDLERSLMRPCGSTAADSSSADGGTCAGTRFTRSGPLLSSRATRIFIRISSRLLDNHWLELVVPVAFVALVRKDVRDHSIWTVAVALVSHPLVTDHHHGHSLELVSVEAPVIEIVVVTAHAIYFQLLLVLSHQQVEELGAIPGGGPGESGGSGGPGCSRDLVVG